MGYGILIIEDETVLAKKMAKFLQQRGFEVRITDNGHDGLESIASF